MNVFKAIGTVLESATNATVELCAATETACRTVNKTVGMAEDAVDAMRAEQRKELEAMLKELESK